MGRPKRPSGLVERLYLRLTTLEKSVHEKESEKAGLTLSEYVRRRALGVRVISRMDDSVINELRRLGGLQKKFAGEIKSHRFEFERILEEIIAAIRRLT